MHRIIACVDGSGPALDAARFAAQLASPDGEVILAHIIEWSPFVIETLEDNEHRHAVREHELAHAKEKIIGDARKAIESFDCSVGTYVQFGSPAELIAKLSEDRKADLIAVGRSGAGVLERVIFGSKASKIIHLTKIPVVIVP